MIQQHDPDIAETDPAQAFEELRKQITVMSRLVENLSSVPDRMPDYTPTLVVIEQSLNAIRDGLVRIESSPAVKLTLQAAHEKIVELSQFVRAEDRQMLIEAQTAMAQAVGRIDAIVERGQAADRDKRKQRWRAAGFTASGMLILSIVLGPVARSLPASWHVPEWIAEGVMALDTKAAAERFSQLAREREPRTSVIADPTPKPESSSPAPRRKSRH